MPKETKQPRVEERPALRRSNTKLPINKVTWTAVAVAITQVALWAYSASGREPIPVEITGAILTVITFVVGYVVPPGRNENVIEVANSAG